MIVHLICHHHLLEDIAVHIYKQYHRPQDKIHNKPIQTLMKQHASYVTISTSIYARQVKGRNVKD